MDTENKFKFQGKKVEILEMFLRNVDNQIEILLKINFENTVSEIAFYNVSRFRIGEVSVPFEIHGFKIVKHSYYGWENDSAYEIRDFEDNCINFFCEDIKIIS